MRRGIEVSGFVLVSAAALLVAPASAAGVGELQVSPTRFNVSGAAGSEFRQEIRVSYSGETSVVVDLDAGIDSGTGLNGEGWNLSFSPGRTVVVSPDGVRRVDLVLDSSTALVPGNYSVDVNASTGVPVREVDDDDGDGESSDDGGADSDGDVGRGVGGGFGDGAGNVGDSGGSSGSTGSQGNDGGDGSTGGQGSDRVLEQRVERLRQRLRSLNRTRNRLESRVEELQGRVREDGGKVLFGVAGMRFEVMDLVSVVRVLASAVF